MYSYRLRMGSGKKPIASKGPSNFLGSCLNGWRNRVHLHTELTFWEFDQVLLSKSGHCTMMPALLSLL